MLAGLLLVGYVVAAMTAIRQKSMTFDELGHLTGGVSVWKTGDYRLFPQNGQLAQRWAALPLVIGGYGFPSLDQDAWRSSDLERIGYQFLYAIGNDHRALLWSARMAMIPVAALIGVLCYAWARRLFGAAGGVISLSAFALSPTMLAHGPLATSDVPAALFFTLSLGCFWQVLHRASAARLVGSGLVMGLLFVTKMSAVLMVPVALILVAVRVWDGRPFIWLRARSAVVSRERLPLTFAGLLVAHVVIVVAVIWAFYGFRYSTFHDGPAGGHQQFLGETIDTITGGVIARPLIRAARDLHTLPEAYLFGLAHVLDRSDRFIGFFNGDYRVGGWWSFFPFTWLVKSPLGWLALLALAAVSGLGRLYTLPRRRLWRVCYPLIPLVTFVAVYWCAAVTSNLNLGERHVLPSYPTLFILAGGAAAWLRSRMVVSAVAVAAALVTLSIECVSAWPHYLSFFNLLAGGPANGYRHLVDSSLDWGQDLPGLKQWLDQARREAPDVPVYLSYFGSGNPPTYGIDARQIYSYQDWRSAAPSYDLTEGIYCVSATMLQNVYTPAAGPWSQPYENAYQRLKREVAQGQITSREQTNEFEALRFGRLAAFLRQRQPDDQIGYSILIFRLSDGDVRQALEGPPAELLPQIGVEQR